MGFSFCHLGHAPGWDFGALEVPSGQTIFFSNMVVWHIKSNEEQNSLQVKFLSKGQTSDLWVRSKGQIALNFGYHVNFKDYHTKLCVCSHK